MMYVIMPSTSLSSKVSMEVVSMMRASIIAGRMLYLFSKYLYYLLIYVIFSKNLVAIVISDCGCKGKNFYFNLPNFFGSFFCFFFSFRNFEDSYTLKIQ